MQTRRMRLFPRIRTSWPLRSLCWKSPSILEAWAKNERCLKKCEWKRVFAGMWVRERKCWLWTSLVFTNLLRDTSTSHLHILFLSSNAIQQLLLPFILHTFENFQFCGQNFLRKGAIFRLFNTKFPPSFQNLPFIPHNSPNNSPFILSFCMHTSIYTLSILANSQTYPFSPRGDTKQVRVKRVSARREFRRVWIGALNLWRCVQSVCKRGRWLKGLWKWHFARVCNLPLPSVREECSSVGQMYWLGWKGVVSGFLKCCCWDEVWLKVIQMKEEGVQNELEVEGRRNDEILKFANFGFCGGNEV